MRFGMLMAPGRLDLVDVPLPEAGAGEVVVRVRAALTCGTDLKAFLRGHPKWAMPTPFGHEFAGEIFRVGKDVEGFREGDPVMGAPTGPCGTCFWCRRQQENLCETLIPEMVLGGYGEYVKLPSRVVRSNLFPKPAGLSFAEAALVEPLACVLFGLEESRVGAGDTALILGGGAIALLHLVALRARGVEDVRIVARNPLRAAAARELGAAEVLEMDARDAAEPVRAGTAGRGADLVIECTGRREVWEAAPGLARRGGEVILFGGCPGGTEVKFDAGRLHYDHLRLRSPFHFTPRAVRAARDLLSTGAVRADPLFSSTTGLDGLEGALRSMQRGDAIKVVIEP